MTQKRLYLSAALLSALVFGCGGGEPKKIPETTAEQKAANDKAHEEMKAKMMQNSNPGGAAPGGAAPGGEAPK